MNEEVGFVWKVLIALCAGIFGVAVALAIQHIKIINMPKWLIALAVMVQLLLSWGLFLFICIFFKSGLLPESIPNDEYSALSVAYFCASIPHIIITTAIVIYNKEVNKWLESRYGIGEGLPSMRSALSDKGAIDKACFVDEPHVLSPRSPYQNAPLSSQILERENLKGAEVADTPTEYAARNDKPRSIFEEESGLCLTSEGDKTLESIPRSEARQSPILTKETSGDEPSKQDSHTCQTCGAKM